MAEILFWVTFALLFYTYLGYPMQLILQSKILPKPVNKSELGVYLPKVSVVIAARNEETNIGKRIKNLLDQNYPGELLEVIVVSDGSDDRTFEIVKDFERVEYGSGSGRVRLISCSTPQGKPNALNRGVEAANGQIIVFADSRQYFQVDAIQNLIANFSDPSVGCVSGELMFVETPESDIQVEMGAYWKYEKMVRKAESLTGSVVGATGAIYAIRKSDFRPLVSEALLDDVLTPINIIFAGKRVIFDGNAVAYDVVSKNTSHEWRRKVRTLAGNWQLLGLNPKLLVPFINPIWWRFVAHKFFRLIVPFALPVFLVTSFTANGPFYKVFAVVQVVFYVLAGIGFFLKDARKIRLVNMSYFFLVLNGAALAGFLRWFLGGCSTAWQPVAKKQSEVGA